jgi:hypothetical protein
MSLNFRSNRDEFLIGENNECKALKGFVICRETQEGTSVYAIKWVFGMFGIGNERGNKQSEM